MRTLLSVLVVAVCLSPVAAAAPVTGTASGMGADAVASTTSSEQVTITVAVVDENGDPVGGANVTVSYDDTQQSSETFANGKAFFDVPEGADVSVDVTAPDMALNRPVTASGVDSETTVDVQVFPAATAVVTVKTPDGTPVNNALVRMKKDGEVLTAASGRTASNGTFVASEVEKGTYTVSVTSSGYYSKSTAFVVSNRAGTTIRLEPGTIAMNFQTVDPRLDDQPVSTFLELYEGDKFVSNISTGGSGTRSVSLDVNTEYRVVVKKNGYERHEHVLETGESDASVTYAINRTPALSVEPANSQVVTGQSVRVTVTDEYDDPVTGASVRVDGETVAETDENGVALVTIESEGDVDVTAIKGALEATVTVQGVSASNDPAETTTDTTESTTTTEATSAGTTSAVPTTTASDEDEGGSIPGFGGVTALLAVALVVAAMASRRNN